jgi:hypothetical protein
MGLVIGATCQLSPISVALEEKRFGREVVPDLYGPRRLG